MPYLRSLLALLALTTVAWADHEVRTLGGKSVKGKVTAITDKELTVQGPEGNVSTPLAQVLSVEIRPVAKPGAEVPYTLVRLLDDSQLRCSKVAYKQEKKTTLVDLTLLSGQLVTVDMAYVVFVLKDAQDAELRKQWDRLLSRKTRRDQVVILRTGELNPLEGSLLDVDKEGKTIQFRGETGGIIPVPLDRPHGLIFFRNESPKEQPTCLVIDTQGNTLAALKVAVDGNAFKVTTTLKNEVTFDEKNLARLDYNMGKLTMLAHMEPTKIERRSWGAVVEQHFRDPAEEKRPWTVGKTTYDTALLRMVAFEKLEFNLDGKYKDFRAVVGVEPNRSAETPPRVTIECDGEKRFSEVIDPANPRTLAINVRDVRRLVITVSQPDDLAVGGGATLAEARVNQ